jgi:hypothetical protein
MSEGDHVNEATEHNTEENSAELVSKESEGEGGAPEGNVHGDEGSDEVKINEQKRTFGEEGEEEDAEEYDDEEEYDDDEDDEGDDDQDQDLSAKLNELRGMMGSFYPFGTQNQYTSVDLVLSKEDFELEELLELDDFLPDLRRGKSNLLSYLVQPEVLEQLVAYISSEPKEDEDEDEAEQ